jgi:hypothetical protein
MDTSQSLDYPVLLSNITSPLFRQKFEGQDGIKWSAFVPLHFRTGSKRHSNTCQWNRPVHLCTIRMLYMYYSLRAGIWPMCHTVRTCCMAMSQQENAARYLRC